MTVAADRGFEDDGDEVWKTSPYPRAGYSLTIEKGANDEGTLTEPLDMPKLIASIREAHPERNFASIRFSTGRQEVTELGLYKVVVDESVEVPLWVVPSFPLE